MAAEWKTAAGARIVSAYGDCRRARQCLGLALQDLESEQLVQNRNASGRYILLDSAANNVDQASWFLSASMGYMAAAEILALRGCGIVPTAPVAGVAQVRDGANADHGVWLALARLQSAREYGKGVLRGAEAACGHLWAAQFVAAHLPPAAGPTAAMEDQVRDAVNQIRGLVGSMVNMEDMASIAFEPPARIQSG